MREAKIANHFTNSQAKGKGSGSMPGNGSAIVAFTFRLGVHPVAKSLGMPLRRPRNPPKSMLNFRV
jgi:hypothetical protein